MAIFCPDAIFHSITEIPFSFFKEKDILAVILDVDNTLASHNDPEPAPGVFDWLQAAKSAGLSVAILSNNSSKRIRPFAEKLQLDYVARAWKPLTFGVTRACRKYQLSPNRVALIGDQIFTDIMGGNLKGVCTILVEPFQLEKGWFFQLKRRLEKPMIRKYYRNIRRK
ncbi:MAG: YqeG family HAD IIIA-type phosphatase [Oscillospiraceae bacterium]